MDSHNEKQTADSRRGLTVKIIILCAVAVLILALAVIIACKPNGSDESENHTGTSELISAEFISDVSSLSDSHLSETAPDSVTSQNASAQNTQISETTTASGSITVTKKNTYVLQSESGDITCDRFGNFSGVYVEDGSDVPIENVAAALITNQTDSYLEYASLTVDIGGKTAVFVVTGLPAHKSAWVLEKNKMSLGSPSSFTLADCTSSFRDDVVSENDKIDIFSDGNNLTVSNKSSKTLKNFSVYYRNLHTDGNFLGGITYMVSFGDIESGASAQSVAGHFSPDSSEIVRISWQD